MNPSRLRRATDTPAPTVAKGNRAAPRVLASRVPSITGVRLSPPDLEATLINISAHGVAVECGRRLALKTQVTVLFDGTFEPSSVEGRVARCTIAGLGPNGALTYQLGIAFASPIALVEAPAPVIERSDALRHGPAITPTPPSTVLRNRW